MTDVHKVLLEAHAWDGRTVQRGIDIVKFCEGWPKGGKPYVCPAGYWTQGYGSLRGLDGNRVTLDGFVTLIGFRVEWQQSSLQR